MGKGAMLFILRKDLFVFRRCCCETGKNLEGSKADSWAPDEEISVGRDRDHDLERARHF